MVASNDLNISQSGYVVFDGISTFTGRTFQAGSGITLTNASGVSGNTTIGLTAGGSSILTLTGDIGGAITPTANNVNVFGQLAGTSQVMETNGTLGTSTITFEDRTWYTKYVVDPSAAVGLRSTYTTIQSAITQAIADGAVGTSGVCILVRNGSYNETITVSTAGVNITISGTGGKSSLNVLNGNPVFTGSFTNSGTGTITFNNIDSSTVATISNTSTGSIYINNCACNASLSNTTIAGGLTINSSILGSTSVTLSGGTMTVWGSSYSATATTYSNAASAAFYFSSVGGTFSGITSSAVSFNNSYVPLLVNNMTGGTFLLFNVTFGSFDFYANSSILYKLQSLNQGNVIQSIKSAGNYIIVANQDYYVGITNTAAPRTVTLPSTVVITNQAFIIKDESGAAATNNITVSVNGGVKTIDGLTSFIMNTNYGSLTLKYDGTNYFII